MKTQRKITSLAILLMAANAVMAQYSNNLGSTDNRNQKLFVQMKVTPQTKLFTANVSEEPDLKFKVWIANPDEEKVTISIRSEEGGYYFNKTLSDAWYSQLYNFSNVDDGVYTIEISKGRECIRKKIVIATDTYTMRTGKVY